MKQIFTFVILIFFSYSLVFGDTTFEQREILIKGIKRFYLIHRPAKFTKNSFVVFLLHGGTQSMRKVLDDNSGGKRWKELSSLHDFILIVPNASNQEGDNLGNKQTWNDCRITSKDSKSHSSAEDVTFLKDLKDTIVKSEGANSEKFFLTGSSNGGMMTLRMAIERPELFKSYAAIIASLPVKSECPAPTRPVALFMLNGTEEPLIPWMGGPAGRPGYEFEIISPEKTRDIWALLKKIDLQKTEISNLPDIDTRDGSKRSSSRVVKIKYYGKMPMEFYQVNGGGHLLPSKRYQIPRFLERQLLGFQNHDIEGADEIWGFFDRSEF